MEVGHAPVRVAGGELNRPLPLYSVLPADLRSWVSENDLRQAVAEAVHRADHRGIRADFTSRWELLLAWTTRAYASGIFSSDEIAEAAGECPFDGGAAIRHFRRCNRAVLEQAVASVFQTCANQKHISSVPRPASIDPAVCAAEARARVSRAVEVDSWSVDDD
jgi:hypothetical protein